MKRSSNDEASARDTDTIVNRNEYGQPASGTSPDKRTTTARLQRASGLVQRLAEGHAPSIAADADARLDRAPRGGGATLPEEVRRELKESLGADLSRVRLHVGAESAAAAAVSARAYPLGQDATGTATPSASSATTTSVPAAAAPPLVSAHARSSRHGQMTSSWHADAFIRTTAIDLAREFFDAIADEPAQRWSDRLRGDFAVAWPQCDRADWVIAVLACAGEPPWRLLEAIASIAQGADSPALAAAAVACSRHGNADDVDGILASLAAGSDREPAAVSLSRTARACAVWNRVGTGSAAAWRPWWLVAHLFRSARLIDQLLGGSVGAAALRGLVDGQEGA